MTFNITIRQINCTSCKFWTIRIPTEGKNRWNFQFRSTKSIWIKNPCFCYQKNENFYIGIWQQVKIWPAEGIERTFGWPPNRDDLALCRVAIGVQARNSASHGQFQEKEKTSNTEFSLFLNLFLFDGKNRTKQFKQNWGIILNRAFEGVSRKTKKLRIGKASAALQIKKFVGSLYCSAFVFTETVQEKKQKRKKSMFRWQFPGRRRVCDLRWSKNIPYFWIRKHTLAVKIHKKRLKQLREQFQSEN